MINVFAREITDDLTSLVKQIDETVAKHNKEKMAAFVVLLSEDAEKLAPDLEKLAEDQKIENTPLCTFDGPAGPPKYKIEKDADVTVLLWVEQTVKANHSFKKGDFTKDSIKKILEDTKKILEE